MKLLLQVIFCLSISLNVFAEEVTTFQGPSTAVMGGDADTVVSDKACCPLCPCLHCAMCQDGNWCSWGSSLSCFNSSASSQSNVGLVSDSRSSSLNCCGILSTSSSESNSCCASSSSEQASLCCLDCGSESSCENGCCACGYNCCGESCSCESAEIFGGIGKCTCGAMDGLGKCICDVAGGLGGCMGEVGEVCQAFGECTCEILKIFN